MRWARAWGMAIAISLAACGGGGGGGGGTGNGATATIAGQATVLDASGDQVPAPAGHAVQLVVLDQQGQPGAVLASGMADANGRFEIALPPGRSTGLQLGVTSSDGAGGRWRAVAMNNDAPVGPASEAVTRELFASVGQRSATVSPHPRLGDLYRNSTLWLGLLNPRTSNPAAAVEQLRTALRSDSAATRAFDELGFQGQLTSSLGDIGGLFGHGQRAIEVDDGDGPLKVSVVRPSPDASNDWTIDEFPTGSSGTPDRIWLRPENDGIVQYQAQLRDSTVSVLLGLIGPHQVQSFRWAPGVDQPLASVRKPTHGFDFDTDGRIDTLVFRLNQRMAGVETVEALGERWRALVFEVTTILTIELSGGGSIVVQGTERRWHVPEIGAVHTVESNESIARDGTVTRGAATRRAVRAVAGDTSWPGRVRITATPLGTRSDYSFPASIGLTADNQIAVAGGVNIVCCSLHRGVSIRPLQPPGVSADILVAPGLLGARTVMSADGRHLYVASSRFLGGDGTNVALPIDQAEALGATLVRYNATTLVEEASLTLPPIPSRLQPGLAFPRHMIRTVLVSPTDSTHAALAGVDAVLVRGTSVVSSVGSNNDVTERLGIDGRARMISDQILLRGWDPDRQELRLEIDGGGASSRAVPITAAGLDLNAMRTSVPVLFNLFRTSDSAALYDRVDSRRLYLDGFRRVVNPDTGALISDLSTLPNQSLVAPGCTPRGAQVICLDSGRIHILNADLQLQRALPLQSDLRRLVDAYQATSPRTLHAASDGSLVYTVEGGGLGMLVYRVVFD